MKIALTGGTGFLGSYIAREAVSRGHKIILLKRSSSSMHRLKDIEKNISYFDLDKQPLDYIFSNGKFDILIHTANCYGRDDESYAELYQTNVIFPANLAEQCVKYNVRYFLNTSSMQPPNITRYALSKKHCLELLNQFANKIHIIHIKPEFIYGVGDGQKKFIPWLLTEIKSENSHVALTTCEQERDFIYVTDAAAAYLYLIENLPSNSPFICELGTGNSFSMRKFCEMMLSKFNQKYGASKTLLNFGLKPSRKGEPEVLKADISCLTNLGWVPKITPDQGIDLVLENC